ncbi:nucleotidyl transferase AbiEii/AbiGii toxin family protein [Armatimonas sp.]|uniref:nucleotidyl transferase AbiEii/AbiGii toxin family protein n=1 Tax=Armatimonas sp. TaxID=1872638 RepID=UPI0037518AC3
MSEPKKQGERNPGASVQAKLKNHRASTGEDMALVLLRYVIERFLYRLSLSPYRDRFVLRGAALFSVWVPGGHRPTGDLDMLGVGESTAETLKQQFLEICAIPVEEDGLVFLPETFRIEERSEGRVYQGLYIEIVARLGTALPRLEVDISFGEAITPGPEEIELPTLLGLPRPRLRAYPRETVVAEKTEALVKLGMGNTRLKDFFDLWYLSSAFSFDGPTLAAALKATFTRRDTPFPDGGLPIALTDEFASDPIKQRQWAAFRKKLTDDTTPTSLEALLTPLRIFLQPLLATLAEERPFTAHWNPGGPWEP